MDALKEKLIDFFESHIECMGYEVVNVDIHKSQKHGVVRLYIDSPNGINMDDCVKVTREVSPALDELDVISFAYTLEVSSPGVNRPLRKESDFKKFTGKQVKITTLVSIGNKTVFKGEIQSIDGCLLKIIEATSGDIVDIDISQIKKANLRTKFSF